jgi:hypothetical protein
MFPTAALTQEQLKQKWDATSDKYLYFASEQKPKVEILLEHQNTILRQIMFQLQQINNKMKP